MMTNAVQALSNQSSSTNDVHIETSEDSPAGDSEKLTNDKNSIIIQKSIPDVEAQRSNCVGMTNRKSFEAKYQMSHLPRRTPVELQFTDLTYCVPNERKKGFKRILKGVSGRFLSGQISAILGPSGAGKSTLLNILTGFRTSKVSGEILVNGKPRCLKSFRKQACYIMQDDHLLQFLTINESMQAAASLKLGNTVSKIQKNNLVGEILSTLSLEENKNTRVSKLSGGEKKRLSIALELVNNPPVMFFDEPTSGLDSQNSYHCISLLRKLAEGGRTIICTIHQPSARLIEKLDYLFALADGHCIYRGTIPGLVPFMSSLSLDCPSYHNPADFLIEVASGEYGNFINQMENAINYGPHYASHINSSSHSDEQNNKAIQVNFESLDNESDVRTPNNNDIIYVSKCETKLELSECRKFIKSDDDVPEYPASFFTQFFVLLVRTCRSILRDSLLTILRLAAHIVIGIIIGILYYNIGNDASHVLSNIGYLFVCILFLVFTSMMPTLLTFPMDMKVFIREHLNNWYSLKAYYCAKTIADMPFQLVFTIIYISIVYFMTNQPPEISKFLIIAVICILTSLVAQSIGLTIGAAMNPQQSIFMGAAVSIPALLFSGFFALFSTIPVYIRWITYLSYIRYGYVASVRITYGNGRKELQCHEPFCYLKYPEKILDQFEIEEHGLGIDILVLFLYFIAMRVLGYFVFRWKVQRER